MVVHAYYPLGETRVEREALALLDYGFEVDVLALRRHDEAAFSVERGVNVYRLPVRRDKSRGMGGQLIEYSNFFAGVFKRLFSLHRERHYDVVQVHNLPDFLIFAAIWPKLTGAKLILDLHDLMPEFFASRNNTSLENWLVQLIRFQEFIACSLADHVITVTDVWRDALIKRGIPAKKVSVVMNLADERYFNSTKVHEPSVVNDQFTLIYHGSMTYRYGIDLILYAIHEVREEIPDIRLILQGKGTLAKQIYEIVNDLDLNQIVQFNDTIVHSSKLQKIILQADVGIVPNRDDIFTDGLLPTKMLEYIALGIPVIAARTSTISNYFSEDMVEFFAPGDFKDLADSIRKLNRERFQLQKLSKNAEKFFKMYNWEEMSRSYISLIDKLSG
jgi:glycosyltransferase involved in cell wall biosynthesis